MRQAGSNMVHACAAANLREVPRLGKSIRQCSTQNSSCEETEYQIMDFRIKQAELWREDVRDIIGLTSVAQLQISNHQNV